MIGKIKNPEHPDQDVYVPLRWNPDQGTWEELAEPRAGVPMFHRSIDAAILCWQRLRDRFHELVHAARLLRVMCEHPSIDFEADAMNPAMLRKQARELASAMAMEQEEVERLLDDPGVDDLVHIRDVRHVLDLSSMRLNPHEADLVRVVPMPPRSPQARYAWLVRICALFAEELTGEEHAPQQVEAVVTRVQERLRHERAGRGTEQ